MPLRRATTAAKLSRLREVSRLDAGLAALRRGAWDDARQIFEEVLRTDDDPRALEGLGLAGWWLDRPDLVFANREAAFRRYREEGDLASAARVAVWIAWDSAAFHGEMAVANGWLARARRLLKDVPAGSSHAFLELRSGIFVLLDDGDPDRALKHAKTAQRYAHKAGDLNFEMVGRALGGFALAMSGRVAAGMAELDEVQAAVLADELDDPVSIGLAGCYLVAACECVHDTDRAVQWCNRIKKYCLHWGLRPLLSVCRTKYASVCVWRGDWAEAERELTSATADMEASRPAMTGEGFARLGELRRRQGRGDDAAALFERAGANPIAFVGAAWLALDRGDAKRAVHLAERMLRNIPAHNRTDRSAALEVLVRAKIALGAADAARAAVTELSAIARTAGTFPLRAAAASAAGALLAGQGDHDDARRKFEDAVDLYERAGAPYETAQSRLDLAGSLGALGETAAARTEARRAADAFARIDAVRDRVRAEALDVTLSRPAPPESAPASRGGLSRREIEVVSLIARGQNNDRIARSLAISAHTVHRHVANILTKLDVPSRSAAVARAAELRLI